jgi:disulfide oxidoreductase YuzD
MSRYITPIVVICLLFTGCANSEPPPEPAPDPLTLTYFYEIICCSCEETPEQKRISSDIFSLSRGAEHIEAQAYDIYTALGHEALKTMADRLGRDAMAFRVPALVVNDEVFLGETSILAELDRLHGR